MRSSPVRVVALGLCLTLGSCAEPGPCSSADAFRLDDHRGKWVLVNYWAIWCGPCREEIPELNALARELPERLVVVGVNYDDLSGEDLAAQSRELGIEFKVLKEDPAPALGYDRPQVLPTTVLFGPQGSLSAIRVGPQTVHDIMGLIGY